VNTRIQITIHTYDNGQFTYDSFQDGPLNEWLIATMPKTDQHTQATTRNATIRVWRETGE
jgi:hypothetical protein